MVVSGQFLLDSESRLREAALKFMRAGYGRRRPADRGRDRARESGAAGHSAARRGEGELYYVCPMPEHADILYDKPGKCPICGMQLVPVRQRGGHVEKPADRLLDLPDAGALVRPPQPGPASARSAACR